MFYLLDYDKHLDGIDMARFIVVSI